MNVNPYLRSPFQKTPACFLYSLYSQGSQKSDFIIPESNKISEPGRCLACREIKFGCTHTLWILKALNDCINSAPNRLSKGVDEGRGVFFAIMQLTRIFGFPKKGA